MWNLKTFFYNFSRKNTQGFEKRKKYTKYPFAVGLF